jgi:mannose/cellobiose epimerase-like protein (N-acyl-D-glucosamine 2-epimerase family)
MNLRYFTSGLRITGHVKIIDNTKGMFELETRSGDIFEVFTSPDTYFYLIKNTDNLDRDRTDYKEPDRLKRYLNKDQLISAYGILYSHNGVTRYDAKTVALLGSVKGEYDFEQGHWWLNQITSFADIWVQRQFGLGDNYDFTQYRTNLNTVGGKTDITEQELDTITRLLYGLTSAYMLTGNQKYLDVVRKGVTYQRDMFKTTSNDGAFVVWHHSLVNGKKILPSNFNEDINTIPLYEQIYAIAGLAQYYKATRDWQALDDIRGTIAFFEQYYRDNGKDKGFYSHIDPIDFNFDSLWLEPGMGNNRSKKNWNSVGDHTPAYMLNLMLAIQDIPELDKEFNYYKDIQKEMADLILEKFYQKDTYIKERFFKDWTSDNKYSWQQDRTVIGHNLKIAWNLTRLYYLFGDQRYLDAAENIADRMPEAGLDMIRGGWYDVVERVPKNGMFLDMPWHNRKAWWQQEQGILAYLILAGTTKSEKKQAVYLDIARESIAFWNLAFLDHESGETYFDVLDNGYPYLQEDRAQLASHSKSGYHSMELNYLAHIYYRLLINKKPLRLHYSIAPKDDVRRLNLMPDYLPKEKFKVEMLKINGAEFTNIVDQQRLQVSLDEQYKDTAAEIIVHIGVK